MTLKFGSYVQLFDAVGPTNANRARTFGAICLLPTCNANGDYYFLSFAMGYRVSRHQCQVLPIPDTAIAQVEALVLTQIQPLIQERGLVVEWRPDHPIDDDEYDRDYDAPIPVHVDPFLAQAYNPIDADELNNLDHTPLAPLAPVIDPLPVFPIATQQGAYVGNEPQNEVAIDAVEHIEHIEHEPGDDFEHKHEGADALDDIDEGNENQGAGAALADIAEGNGNQGSDNDDQFAEFDKQGDAPADEGPVQPRYNLRRRTNPTNGDFKDAMDASFDNK